MKATAERSLRPTPADAGRGAAWRALAALLLLLVGALLGLGGCRRQTASPAGHSPRDDHRATPPPTAAAAGAEPHALPDFEVAAVAASEGDARWYDVPERSLAQRRAWPGELTAASDRVPPGTYVRVHRLDGRTGNGSEGDGGKGIIVRITDDGVHDKNIIIDLNREAAKALGMVKAGQVRVRVETLALKNATADKPVDKKDAAPTAPKASQITDEPVADAQQEKDAANAKTGGQSAP